MAQETINIGTVANDGTGDTIRASFEKVNNNFTELYSGAIATTGANVQFNESVGYIYGTRNLPSSGDIVLDDNVVALNETTNIMYHQQGAPPAITPNGFNVTVYGRYLDNMVNTVIITYVTDSEVIVSFIEQPSKVEQVLAIASGVTDWNINLGLSATISLTEDVTTFNLTNVNNDDVLILRTVQDVTGGRSLALPAGTVVGGDGQGVIDLSGQTSLQESLISFYKANNILFANFILNYTS